MAIYGIDKYGTTTYGNTNPVPYRVDPFIAVSVSENTINISWTKPVGTILAWRIVKNMFGPPTDQDDGQIILDVTTGYPGNSFNDTNVVPGRYHYYGFFVLTNFSGNQWTKSATTGCLAFQEYESHQWLKSLIPSFYTKASNAVELTGVVTPTLGKDMIGQPDLDDVPETFLDAFLMVLGFGVDYLRTQYNTYLNTNNPWTIPINDLFTLAAQLGLNINPDIHPHTLRKAVYFNAIINKQRGTQQGFVSELSALTGWSADIQVGKNFMLENDQSAFLDPVFPAWSAYIAYNIGENVQFGNFWYQCIATGNIGNAPTGTSSSNTWWSAILGVNSSAYLTNPKTTEINTWDVVYPNAVNGQPAAGSIIETLGVQDPQNPSIQAFNSLQGINKSGSTGTIWLRSIARTPADFATVTTTFAPNKDQVIGDGIPVPFSFPSQQWNATTRYATNQIVIYNNQPFIALRASTGIVPPYTTIAGTNLDWAPASLDQRFRIMISSFLTGSSAVPATPFVEWYDANGNFITRVFSRNAGTNLPNNFAYDSFVAGAGNFLNGRQTDDSSSNWTCTTGSYVVSPYGGGCVYPSVGGQRTLATINMGTANCQVGVTFVTNPAAGQSEGLILRYQNNNNYLRADQTVLKLKSGGSFSTLGTYSTAFSAGDRMIVQLNGSTITVLRNNVQVLQVTNAFNTSGTVHGIINENT